VNAGHRSAAIAVAFVVAALIALRPEPARADRVDDLISELSSSSDRVRLSATLNLGKLGDPRAIDPLIQRLLNDSDKSVRSTAATGLGALVTSSVQGALRQRVVQALQNAEKNDPHPVVQAQAGRALQTIGASAAPPPPQGGGGGSVYVNIGPMSSKTTNQARNTTFRTVMVQTATKTMNKKAPNMPTTWPGGGVPTQAALAQKSTQGFYIDGTVNSVTTNVSGSSATISCKVSMLLADFPNKSVFGFLNGGANVQGSSSPAQIAIAEEDCVAAVVEDLIEQKIIPTISSKSGVAARGGGGGGGGGGARTAPSLKANAGNP
jgi:hypothetical protein